MSQPYLADVSPVEGIEGPPFKLSANENPFGPSPLAMAAMQAAVPTLGLYPPSTDKALREKLAQLHGLTPAQFVTANSGCDVLRLVALAYLNQDSSIVICSPTFPVYERTARQVGATVIDVPLDLETFTYRPEAIRAAIRPDTSVVYLCNPNNPTGTVFGQAMFDQLLDAIPDDVLVVYDEVYYHFVTDVAMPDARAAVRAGKSMLIIHSFSKVYGMAGLRMGYGIARADISERLESQKNVFHSSSLALKAAEAALADSDHIHKTVANNTAERALVVKRLLDLSLTVWPSQANFVLFEVPSGFTPEVLTDKLQDYNVMVRPAFGLTNHLRVSIGLPEANRAFLKAIEDILASGSRA